MNAMKTMSAAAGGQRDSPSGSRDAISTDGFAESALVSDLTRVSSQTGGTPPATSGVRGEALRYTLGLELAGP